jgi:acetyl esterase
MAQGPHSRMAALLEKIRRAGRPALHTLEVSQARAFYEAAAEMLDFPRCPLARVEDLALPLGEGVQRAARLYQPHAQPLKNQGLVLFFHGGGYTLGSLETHDSLCRQMARRSGWMVLALDYRLAPEHPFPAATEDASHALAWLATHADRLGGNSQKLVLAGDSAGATLAAVTALWSRHQPWAEALRGQILLTPGTAPDFSAPSHARYGQGMLLETPALAWFFGHYASEAQRQDWRFAPLLAPDFHGLPAALLVLAGCDPLLDEGLAYGDALRMQGVAVELELFKGVTHDFIKMGRALPEADQAHEAMARFLKQL